MRYIIDGYNLIGKVKSLSLSDPQKEEKLITWLKHNNSKITDTFLIVFDGKNPMLPNGHTYMVGRYKLKFTSDCESADDYIIRSIRGITQKMGVVIVSSDNQIIKMAKTERVGYMRSEDFIGFIRGSRQDKVDKPLKEDEVDYWIKRFGGKL